MLTRTVDPRLVGTRRVMIKIPKTSPCHLTISHSENCAQADHLKNALLELFREFGHKPPASLNGPAMNLSLLQTLMFWFVWLHYVLGT